MIARFDAVRLFIFVLILRTLQPYFTLWLSAQTLQCFLRACACHSTFAIYLALTRGGLSVLLWMWCCTKRYGLANNSVKKLSVTLWFYLQRHYKTFCCVCLYQSALCRQCVLVLYGLRACFKTIILLIWIKTHWPYKL